MVKNIIIGALALIVVGAVGVGVYDAVSAAPAQAQTDDVGKSAGGWGQGAGAQAGEAAGQSNGGAQGQAAATGAHPGTGTAEPQAIPSSDWSTLAAEVQAVEVNGLSVLTADGQPLWIQLGPTHFWSGEIAFSIGDTVSVTGFIENGQFMAAVIANDTSGQTFTLRSETGQPLWAGGSNGNGGSGGKGNGNGNR